MKNVISVSHTVLLCTYALLLTTAACVTQHHPSRTSESNALATRVAETDRNTSAAEKLAIVPLPQEGNLANPIIDSAMTREAALKGVQPRCPENVLANQKLFSVKYYSFDGRVHQGQLVMDRRLVSEIQEIFKMALEIKFPVASMIPISHPSFLKNGRWDDNLSMQANNTSGFNYRRPTNGGPISKKGHAMGFAIDINPMQNPYIKRKKTLPAGSTYDVSRPGTLTANHPIVKKFIEFGWTWGGRWRSVKDYQHFQKTPKESRY